MGVLGAAGYAWVRPTAPADLSVVGPLVAAAILAGAIPLRLHRRGGVQAFTLDDGVLIAMLFALPAGLPPLLMMAGVAGQLLISRRPLKLFFNAGQMALWTVAASLAFHAIGPAERVISPRSLLAVVAATVAMNAVNWPIMAELFRRAEGRRYRDTFANEVRLQAITWLGNTSFGLLLAVVVREDPLAAMLMASLMVGLFLGYRGYARMLADRERTEQLHAVTTSLTGGGFGSVDPSETFLEQVRRLFSAERAELLLRERGRGRLLSVGADGVEASTSGDVGLRPTLELALAGMSPARAEDGAALAAPLVVEGAVVGALGVTGRVGLEPWDDRDLTLLASLANETAVAVRNLELVASLREQTRKLGDIVTAASDGIVLIDEHGRIAEWNRAMERVTGTRAADALQRPWWEVLRAADGTEEQLREAIERTAGGTRSDVAVDIAVAAGPGRTRWLRCTFAPVDARGGPAVGVVVVARDVTRELEAEHLKEDFLATVSHELRTPLTPLRGFLSTASLRWRQLPDEQVETMFEAMSRQVDRLEALVADLLAIADVDRDRFGARVTDVALLPIVRLEVHRAGLGGSSRIELSAADDVHAIADPRAVARIVQALLSNAIKHTAGAVRVSVGRQGEDAVVAVADDGPGIAPWEQDEIFQPFRRLGDHLTRPTQGPGLGLAIARNLAQRLGGRLEVRSDPGCGATFELRLPASAVAVDVLRAAAPAPAPSGD